MHHWSAKNSHYIQTHQNVGKKLSAEWILIIVQESNLLWIQWKLKQIKISAQSENHILDYG